MFTVIFLFLFPSLLLQGYPMHELSTILFFLIPVAILSYLYISMALALKGSIRKSSIAVGNGGDTLAVPTSAVHGGNNSSSRKQIIRMLGIKLAYFHK